MLAELGYKPSKRKHVWWPPEQHFYIEQSTVAEIGRTFGNLRFRFNQFGDDTNHFGRMEPFRGGSGLFANLIVE